MESYKELAKIYDELIYEDINYEDISKYIMKKCNEFGINPDSYCDLGCGTANLSVFLASNFKNNYLVDLSNDMLMEAQSKLRNKRIKSKFILQDMSDLQLNHKFDLITCALDGSNYILDEEYFENYLKCVYNHLKTDGIFIFDINSYYKLSHVLGNNIYTYNSEEVFYVWENIFEDEIVEMNLTFFKKIGELYERFEETHEERAYKEEYIEKVLDRIGFTVLEKHDGYTDEDVQDNSERIVYIIRK